jgi:RNA polymerase sigma-70 factor (ECF subfamily)
LAAVPQVQAALHSAGHYHGVRRFIERMARDGAPVDDLVQETFAVALENGAAFRQASSVRRWLCGIALNLLRRHRAREAIRLRAVEYLSELETSREDPDVLLDEVFGEVERYRAVVGAYRRLPPTYRGAFALRHLQGLRTAQAARELGISEANVRVRVARAVARIRSRVARLA